MDNQECFELLSAYLDQELSPEETQDVEQWLKQDDQARRTYQKLLQLRYRLRDIPVSSSPLPSQMLSEKVITKAHHQNFRNVLLWGGGTLAALFVVIITGVFSTMNAPLPRLARSNDPKISNNSLMIALDQPIMEIPKDSPSSDAEAPSSRSPTP
ncbi:MAG: zf-HC2 domain-containing protein [Halothece sp. Uz-M2-17]|nr:zf-HC2 domain-containing protein [Halothece sp. Uz-M2-17]